MADSADKLPPVRSKWRVSPALLFWLVWIGAAAGAGAFYFESPDFAAITGVGETVESHISAPEVARIAEVHVALGQIVEPGDVLVTFDLAQLQRDADVLAAQIAKAEADLTAGALELRRDAVNDRFVFEKAYDISDVGVIQAEVQADLDKAQAEGLRKQIGWWEGRVQKQLVAEQPLVQLRGELAAVEKRLGARALAVTSWRERQRRVEERLAEYKKTLPPTQLDTELPELAPFRATIEVVKKQLAQIEGRRKALTVRAGIGGVVHRIYLQPGDMAQTGAPLVVIRQQEVKRVIAYAIGAVARRLHIGGQVRIERRDGTGQRLRGHVTGFSGVEPLPLQLQSVPARAPLAAEEIIIAIDDGAVLPGEPVDVEFIPGVLRPPKSLPLPARLPQPQKAHNDPPPAAAGPPQPPAPQSASSAVPPPTAPSATDSHPQPLPLPPLLAARTRMEPSGLVWLAERDRYAVISDDTGFADRDEHAPWIFGLDRDGHWDAAPWVVAGLPEINDLESIARAGTGPLWLLSSQSISKKGKRGEARTLLVQVQVAADKLQAVGTASLAVALQHAKDPQRFKELGITQRDHNYVKGADGFDRELEIEGMAADGDGLLLGLKRPLDPRGAAMIWRLANAEDFVRSGKLQAGQLVPFASWPLVVGPPDQPLHAGISDLCKLPDGRLLLLAVALGDADEGRPERGLHSALFSLRAGGQPEKLRDFAGQHAEGVAQAADGHGLTVVFDRGAEVPMWMRLP